MRLLCATVLPPSLIRRPRWPRSMNGSVPSAVSSARSREPPALSRVDKTRAAYLASLRRLEKARPVHPRLVGQHISINVSTVCLEAGLSRNPLYAQQHRDVLDQIRTAAERQREEVRGIRKSMRETRAESGARPWIGELQNSPSSWRGRVRRTSRFSSGSRSQRIACGQRIEVQWNPDRSGGPQERRGRVSGTLESLAAAPGGQRLANLLRARAGSL